MNVTIACFALILGSVCVIASHSRDNSRDTADVELQAREGALPVVNRAERYRQFQLSRSNRFIMNLWQKTKDAATDTVNKIGGVVSGAFPGASNAVSAFFSGLGTTWSDFFSGAYSKIATALSNTAKDVEDALNMPRDRKMALLENAYLAVSAKIEELKTIVDSKTGMAREGAKKLLDMALKQRDNIHKMWESGRKK